MTESAAMLRDDFDFHSYFENQEPPLDFCWAHQLPVDPDPEDEIVEGVIGRAAMSILYGDSNCGKTFLAIDLACSVARARDWMGRRVVHGLVVYLATESPRSVRTRLQAYRKYHAAKHGYLAVVQSPINLFDGTADAMAVVELIRRLETETGTKCNLVIGDTLARMTAGANENSGEDMGTVIGHAECIRRNADVHVLLIHHSGKDQARGARGWSGLRAAIDTEIEVTVDEATGLRAAEITKQRDGRKGDRFGFRLDVVEMGEGQWGTPRTSCVVVPAEAPQKPVRAKRQSEIAGAITEFLRERGSGCLRGALAAHFKDMYARQSVYREVGKMLEAGLLTEVAGVVALPGKPGSSV